MSNFIRFLVDNWQIVGAAILCLLSFIINLFRKKPVAYNFGDYIRIVCDQFLATYVINAENTGLSGDRKKEHVIAQCMKCLKGFVHCTDRELDEAYVIFGNKLEALLSTPQKKQ